MTRINITPPALTPQQIKRFWSRVNIVGPDECWEWLFGVDKDGYGQIGIGPACAHRKFKTHRLAYFLVTGIWPQKILRHTCDNPPCCNPNHLKEGSDLDNKRDAWLKGRNAKGSRHGHAKMSEAVVIEARKLYDGLIHTYVSLAANAHVRPTTMRLAVLGRTWRHI